jgi:hypothetical protein
MYFRNGDQINKDETNGVCIQNVYKLRYVYKILAGKSEETGYLRNLVLDCKIILRRILRNEPRVGGFHSISPGQNVVDAVMNHQAPQKAGNILRG